MFWGLGGIRHYIGITYSHEVKWNLEEKSLKQMSYNYLLCFQESRFWPCPCRVKLRDKDSSVWGKSAISTYILKVGILPVCVHGSPEVTHRDFLYREEINSLVICTVWRVGYKKTRRTLRGFIPELPPKAEVCSQENWWKGSIVLSLINSCWLSCWDTEVFLVA